MGQGETFFDSIKANIIPKIATHTGIYIGGDRVVECPGESGCKPVDILCSYFEAGKWITNECLMEHPETDAEKQKKDVKPEEEKN